MVVALGSHRSAVERSLWLPRDCGQAQFIVHELPTPDGATLDAHSEDD